MAGVLLAVLLLVGHVAVRTGNARSAVGAVLPGFVFGVLRLDDVHARHRMHEIRERAVVRAVGVVVFIHVFRIEAVVPREHGLARRAVVLVGEVVFHMALAAHQAALFVARERCPVLAASGKPVLERDGVELKLHVRGVVAGGAADAFVHHVHLRAVFVEVAAPHAVAFRGHPLRNVRHLAVPAGGGHVALAVRRVAVDAVDIQNVLHRVGMAARLVVFIHEGIPQPQILQVRLGRLEALGKRIHAVVLAEVHRTLVFRHHRRFVVLPVGRVLQREGLFKFRGLQRIGGKAAVVDGRLHHTGVVFTACKKKGTYKYRARREHRCLIHQPPP